MFEQKALITGLLAMGSLLIANVLAQDPEWELSNSDVGIGTGTPSAKLHVSDEADAKVLVENTTVTAAPRTLFELQNAGNTKFTVNNTDADEAWAFANPGSGFRLSRQGSGVVEFEILNSGDAVLAGALTQNSDVNAKSDIVEIDPRTVLAKVMGLSIAEWSYKSAPDSRHLGPMAQDFYQAFQLGHTEKGISSLDTGGVALAAIQAVKFEKDNEIEKLKAENKALHEKIMQQNEKLTQLKAEQDGKILQLEMALNEVLRNRTSKVEVGLAN